MISLAEIINLNGSTALFIQYRYCCHSIKLYNLCSSDYPKELDNMLYSEKDNNILFDNVIIGKIIKVSIPFIIIELHKYNII